MDGSISCISEPGKGSTFTFRVPFKVGTVDEYYHLILMDIQMPNMNGYQASEAIRKLQDPEKSNIPIIAVTANAFEDDCQNAFASGMNDHLAKPVDFEKLVEILEKYLLQNN